MAKYSPEEIKRLDDRMAELDRLRSDPTMKLVQNKSGKFQYVLKEPELKSLSNKGTAKSKPAAPKPAASKSSDADLAIAKAKKSPAVYEPVLPYKQNSNVGEMATFENAPTNFDGSPYRTRGRGLSSEGSREALQNLSNRTSPRVTKITPQSLDTKGQSKVRAYEGKMESDAEKVKTGRAIGTGLALTLAPELAALRPAMAVPRVVQGTLLPREAARLSGPRVAGMQSRLSGPKPAPRSPKPDTVYVNPRGEASGSRTAVGTKQLPAPYKKPKPSVPKRRDVIRVNEKGDEVYSVYYKKGGKVKKFDKGGAVPDGDVQSNRDIGKRDPSLNKRKSTAPFTMDEMKGGLSTGELNKKTRPFDKAKEKKYAAGGKVKKMAGGGMFGSVPVGAAKGGNPTLASMYGAAKGGSGTGGSAPTGMGDVYSKYQQMRGNPKPPAVSPGIRKGIGDAYKAGMAGLSGLGARAGTAYGMKRGGKVGESKEMMKQEIEFFKKKKAPKAMIKHEEKEAKGMKRGGGKMMKFAGGGAISIDGCATKGRTRAAGRKK